MSISTTSDLVSVLAGGEEAGAVGGAPAGCESQTLRQAKATRGVIQGRPMKLRLAGRPARLGQTHMKFIPIGGMKTAMDGDIVLAMAAYDPNIEHNPKIAIMGAIVLVVLGFATVAFIVYGSEMKNAPAGAVQTN